MLHLHSIKVYHRPLYRPISSQLSAVSYIHKLSNQSDPTQSFIIKKMLTGIHKLGSKPDIRVPFTVSQVCNLIISVDHVSQSTYMCVMFKAMYSLAFHALLRVGEFTSTGAKPSPNLLQFQHVSFENCTSLIITFYDYKHSTGRTPSTLSIKSQSGPSCPVVNMSAYFKVRGSYNGPLFCFPGGLPVTRSVFMSLFKKSLAWVGLDPLCYKGHSFRIGKATSFSLVGR